MPEQDSASALRPSFRKSQSDCPESSSNYKCLDTGSRLRLVRYDDCNLIIGQQDWTTLPSPFVS